MNQTTSRMLSIRVGFRAADMHKQHTYISLLNDIITTRVHLLTIDNTHNFPDLSIEICKM